GNPVVGAKDPVVSSYEEAVDTYNLALSLRKSGSTKWNLQSSRSHLMVAVRVMDSVQERGKDGVTQTKEKLFCCASLFDLAGSEEHDPDGSKQRNREVGGFV
ncbi:hypothetical protein KIPB_016002, partial [Kipferlia bialata]